MEKRKIYGMIIGIIAFAALVLGVTYAFYGWSSDPDDNINVNLTVAKSLENSIVYNQGNPVLETDNADFSPVYSYTDEGTISTTIEFWKKANVTKTIYGVLSMEILNMLSSSGTTDANIAKTDTIKWVVTTYNVNNNNEVLLQQGTFNGRSIGDKYYITPEFELNNYQTFYKIYLWLDAAAVDMNNSIVGELLSTEISASATDTSSIYNDSPNAPELTDNLIPVKYDETCNNNAGCWVTADSTNTDNDWYDYDEKKWANAVLVRDTGYEENLSQTNKSVTIANVPSGIYKSNNKGVNSSSSISIFTFETGASGGTFSFDYTVSSEQGYDNLTIKLNDATIINTISGTQSSTYSTTLTANTEYTMTATYSKDSSSSSGDDQATISNIVLPSGLTTGLSVTASGSYGWVQYYSVPSYTSYTLNGDIGKYVLQAENNISSTEAIGKYICSDASSTECTEMYQIKSASGNNIISVDVYTLSSVSNMRNTYKTSPIGTEVKDSTLLAFYVWIPRYKYKVWNKDKIIATDSYGAETTGIDIIFEKGTETTGTITCEYSFTAPSSSAGSPNETCTGANGDYYTHPAFKFGDKNLSGIWVGKFEISSSTPTASNGGGSSTSLTVRTLPNVNSWRSNQVTNFWKVVDNMQVSSNEYGLTTDHTKADSHLLTNMEWGAVAYLTHSKYGRCNGTSCTEVAINSYFSSNTYKTGCGPQSSGSTSSGSTCNAYTTTLGLTASTTGNIYGIYDMSGGGNEYVMGNMSSAAGSYTYYASSGGSNFTYSTSNSKYITTYAKGSSEGDQTAYNRGRLGDATSEVVVEEYYGWYDDDGFFPQSDYPWFVRGGYYYNGTNAGVFYFFNNAGVAYNSGSARSALAVFSA